jgi:hypothetical protein
MDTVLMVTLPARALAWHHQGDYLTTVAPSGGAAAVLVHQRSRCATQALFKRNRGCATNFCLSLRHILIRIRLGLLKHRADIVADVDVCDVDRKNIVSSARIETTLKHGLGNAVRVFEHYLVRSRGSNGCHNTFAHARDDCLLLSATHETIQVGTHGNPGFNFYLNAIFGHGINGGATARWIWAIDNLRAYRSKHSFEH